MRRCRPGPGLGPPSPRPREDGHALGPQLVEGPTDHLGGQRGQTERRLVGDEDVLGAAPKPRPASASAARRPRGARPAVSARSEDREVIERLASLLDRREPHRQVLLNARPGLRPHWPQRRRGDHDARRHLGDPRRRRGKVFLDGTDITSRSEAVRAAYLGGSARRAPVIGAGSVGAGFVEYSRCVPNPSATPSPRHRRRPRRPSRRGVVHVAGSAAAARRPGPRPKVRLAPGERCQLGWFAGLLAVRPPVSPSAPGARPCALSVGADPIGAGSEP